MAWHAPGTGHRAWAGPPPGPAQTLGCLRAIRARLRDPPDRRRLGFRARRGRTPRCATRGPRPSHQRPAPARHGPTPETHVRSHRDRREAVPRRGRNRAGRRASRCRGGPGDHPRTRPPRGRRRRRRDRPPRRRRRDGERDGPAQRPRRQGHLVQVQAEGATPGEEGPSPGADGAPDHGRRAQRPQRCGGSCWGRRGEADRAAAHRGGRGDAGRRRCRPRGEARGEGRGGGRAPEAEAKARGEGRAR